MKLNKQALLGLALLVPLTAHAVDFYFGLGAGMYQVDDADLNTDSVFSPYFVVGAEHPLSRNTKITSEFQYTEFAPSAGVGKMGMDVTSIDWTLAYSYQYPLSYKFHPVFSAGLVANYGQYSKRHSIDEFGYLADRFDDKDEISGGFLLSASHDFHVDQFDFDWSTGLQLRHAFGGVSSFGVYAVYRF
ncbi:hypothetical protein [Ferrimonas kyonanensis]|uniref:hypothetical protein n=1 Tax=Ferrimonas kyonanensis TaxID=364763 RepID=UPI00047FBD70|nr:hypothetical protein [Ferrimonas kyonanensis]